MTVAELITELGKCPMELEVFDEFGYRIVRVDTDTLHGMVELITEEQ